MTVWANRRRVFNTVLILNGVEEIKMETKSTQSLCDIIEAKIQKDYFEGKGAPPTFLPAERELCERYGVSRITVREALRGLEARGYVRRLRGRGIECIDNSAAVVSQSVQTLIARSQVDYHRILEIRYMLERQTARYAAIRADSEDIANLQICLKQMMDKRASYDDYLAADMRFHVSLGVASKNVLLMSLVEALIEPLRGYIEKYTDRQMRLEPSYRYHARILDAVINKDAEEAEKQMMRHLITTETLMENQSQKPPSPLP